MYRSFNTYAGILPRGFRTRFEHEGEAIYTSGLAPKSHSTGVPFRELLNYGKPLSLIGAAVLQGTNDMIIGSSFAFENTTSLSYKYVFILTRIITIIPCLMIGN